MPGRDQPPENEPSRSFSGAVGGGSCQGEVNLPKMSGGARFRGLWVVVVARQWWWVVVVTWERSYPPENEPSRSFSGVVGANNVIRIELIEKE